MEKRKTQKQKENPMENSGYCYYQTFGKVLAGFAKALELRKGSLSAVSSKDILDYAEVDKDEYDFLFGSPEVIYEDIGKELKKIFSEADAILEYVNPDLMLRSILLRLKTYSPMLTVLRLSGDHAVWQDVLSGVVSHLAPGWPPQGSALWDYLYRNFCCQFALILEKWEEYDFAEEKVDACVYLIRLWLEVPEKTLLQHRLDLI